MTSKNQVLLEHTQNGASGKGRTLRKLQHPLFGVSTLVAVVVCVALLWYFGLLHLWEDGSWAVGVVWPWWFKGCLPFFACSL